VAHRELRGVQQLVLFRGAGLWSKSSLYFLAMMLIVGYMATKKEWMEPVSALSKNKHKLP
jgi:hypothetical protein